MPVTLPVWSPSQLPVLLRGEAAQIAPWLGDRRPARLALHLAVIAVGAGLFGAAAGAWRGADQASYVAIKFPLVILLTWLGNALLNGMLAPLLGLNLGLRASLRAVLFSFTIASVILGAGSPLIAFLVWNLPPLGAPGSGAAHSLLLLTLVATIAFAGVVANVRLLQLLQHLGGSVRVARRVLLAWLAGSLFLGSQISWILRPFVGSPGLPVAFLREDAFSGSFFEAVFRAARHLLSAH
jgi:hypothetical protein